ncbi:hypothetical protein JHK82_033766 [Glycine max]|nr:hypothetical protein JHK82_033766 [Glycine max]
MELLSIRFGSLSRRKLILINSRKQKRIALCTHHCTCLTPYDLQKSEVKSPTERPSHPPLAVEVMSVKCHQNKDCVHE